MSSVLRLIAGGLLALICCYIGVLIKKRYKSRAQFYKSAGEYAEFMRSELTLAKTPIPEISQKFLAGRSGDFEKTLSECSGLCRQGKGAEAFDNVGIPILKAAEKKEVIAFLGESGKNSLEDELRFVNYHLENFQKKQKKCEEESKKMGGMYFKLLVLLGIAIMLILA